MDCTPPESSVHGILQARILEWGCHFLLQNVSIKHCESPVHLSRDSDPQCKTIFTYQSIQHYPLYQIEKSDKAEMRPSKKISEGTNIDRHSSSHAHLQQRCSDTIRGLDIYVKLWGWYEVIFQVAGHGSGPKESPPQGFMVCCCRCCGEIYLWLSEQWPLEGAYSWV